MNAQNLEELVQYVKRGFRLSDVCVHDGDHAGQEGCLLEQRDSSDAHLVTVPFDVTGEVVIHPAVRWRLGTVSAMDHRLVQVEVQPYDL